MVGSNNRVYPEGARHMKPPLGGAILQGVSRLKLPQAAKNDPGVGKREPSTVSIFYYGRRGLLGFFVLSILLLAVGGPMYKTSNSINASRSAFIVLEKSLKFSTDYGQISAEFQVFGLVYGYSEGLQSYWQDYLYKTIERKIVRWQRLERSYQHHIKKAPDLKKANKKFDELSRAFDGVIEGDLLALDLVLEIGNFSNVLNFDSYVIGLISSDRFSLFDSYADFQDKVLEFTDELRIITVNSQTDTQLVTLLVQFFLLVVLLVLAFSLHKLFKESGIQLAAQDKLLRQQMHEARNKFCPAMYMMEQFLETAQKKKTTVHDFRSLADDMHMALVALKEVEAQHQARLDMYKILQGKYGTNKETFDILELMHERSAVERTVALARARATNSPIADFVSVVDDASKPHHNKCGALFIQTDLYILNHVIANLLSNARKFCSSGEIKLSFNGTNSDELLIFSVRDSGSGLPAALRNEKTLFGQGVISGDNRGTGLGLPSCHLFCKAGGGYIKLKESKQVDERSSGFTEFEFALKGKIIRADMRRSSTSSNEEIESTASVEPPQIPEVTRSYQQDGTPPVSTTSSPEPTPCPSPRLSPATCPDNVQVVAIDDSALNRTCVIRSFKKIERASNAKGFQYFQFETIESSMPYFRDLKDSSKVIVLLDENLDSRGGVLHGIQGTRWLLHELNFSGIIISTSGDPDVGRQHLQEGANVMNWGKPLPKFEKMLEDVTKALASTTASTSPKSQFS